MSEPGKTPEPDPPEQDEPPARPEYIPESYWDADKRELKVDALKGAFGELDTLRAFKSDAEKATGAIPKDEAGYKIELPKDFKLPEGQRFTVDESDPLVKNLRKFAVTNKLSQNTVTGLVGMYMQIVADGMAADAAAAAEVPAPRVDAVKTWISSNVFESDEQRAPLLGLLGFKQGVETLERIQKVLSGVSGAGHSAITPKSKAVDITGKTAMQIFEAANN